MALIDWVTTNRRFFKRKPERSPKDQPMQPASTMWAGNARPSTSYRSAVSADQALLHPVLYRVLHKIASSVAAVSWYIEADPYAKVTEAPPQKLVKALEDLLHSPSDTLAENQLRYWMGLSFACFGRVPIKVGVGIEGTPNGIYALDVRHFSTVFDERGIPKHYIYGTGDNKEKILTRKSAEKSPSKPAYAYEISIPDLSGSPSGKSSTPLSACGLPADIITLLMQRAADTAAGHPNAKYIVTAEKTLTKGQKNSLKQQISEAETGDEESGHILFMYNTKVDVHKLDNDLSNIHSKVPLDDMSRMIAGLFGVPVALMGFGAADAAKFAGNYLESRESFWADTIIPMYLEPIATGLTAALCPYGVRVRFDYDTIESLKAARMARAKTLEKVPFLTDDEKREMCGFGPLPNGAGAKISIADGTGSETDDQTPSA